MTEYIITGRFVKDDKPHNLSAIIRNKAEAERMLNDIKRKEEQAKKKGKYTDKAGSFLVDTPYQSDYALVDLKILSREVTKWAEV